MSAESSPKEELLDLINKSTDEHLGGPKSLFRLKNYLDHISFSDVVDLVLYYISLQPDMEKISMMESQKFYELLQKTMRRWAAKAKDAWGYEYCKSSYYHPGGKQRVFSINDIALRPWSSGSGPAGPAKSYAYLVVGFLRHKNLLLLFSPEELARGGGAGNWPAYQKYHIEELVFPKWRRQIHAKKLEAVFQLAEMICAEMRKQQEIG